ncbi:MAG: hypothetical protein OJF51_004099 [Nitrospira sp.]|nr:MAG: hypothetical protein OJF51_004099 [Nitrospira sp.]
MWRKKCLVLAMKKRRRILDAERFNVEHGFHDPIEHKPRPPCE